MHRLRKGERRPELGRAGKQRRQQQHLQGKPTLLSLSAGIALVGKNAEGIREEIRGPTLT